jgi:5,10-methylenetetrahydromethanopterin reductase
MPDGLPKIGMRLHGGLPAQRCVELATMAEASGFQSLWFAENPFNRGVWPAMTACLLATQRMRIGVGVFNPYNRHPTLIAMEIAAFDELAQGRSALGIGSGIGDRVTRSGMSYAKPLAAVRDCVNIVRGMLHGETVTYTGATFSVDAVRLECPVLRPDMPIYVAATGDQALRVAGQVADGVMISNMSPPGFTLRAQGILAEGAAKAGRAPPRDIVQYVPCVVREDAQEARRIVRTTIGEMLSAYWRMGAQWPAVRAGMVRESGIPPEEFAGSMDALASGSPAVEVLDDRYVDNYSLAGDRDAVAGGMARFAAVGVTELVVTLVGTEPEKTAAALRGLLASRRVE